MDLLVPRYGRTETTVRVDTWTARVVEGIATKAEMTASTNPRCPGCNHSLRNPTVAVDTGSERVKLGELGRMTKESL